MTPPFGSIPPVRTDPELLVSPVTGIVTHLGAPETPAGAPADYACVVAQVADMRSVRPWLTDRIAAGTAFADPAAARIAAIGEAVERYCGNIIPDGMTPRTVREVDADRVLGPRDLPGWTAAQHARPGFPFTRFAEDTRVRWTYGLDATGVETAVPASWAYLNYFHGPRRRDPRINHLPYTGIATGAGPHDAARRGLVEVVERDAFVCWWLLGTAARGLEPRSLPGFPERWSGLDLELDLVLVPTDLPMPVIGALVTDRRTGVPAAGFSAGADPVGAAWKAIAEALQVWIASSGLLDADGPSWRAMKAGVFSARAYLPFRADRRYLDDAGEDFSRIRDLAAQTQLWLDARMHHLAERFRPGGPRLSIEDVPSGDVDAVVDRLVDAGRAPVAVDLTTPDIAETGLAVIRVVAPGLQPNAPAAYAYLRSARLEEVARLHGRPSPAAVPGSVTLAPPPHN